MASITPGAGAFQHPAITPLTAPVASNPPEPPAPAVTRSSESAGTALAHRRSALNRRAMLPGTDPLSARDDRPPAQAVVGVSDQGLAVVNGALHAWSAQDSKWLASGLTGVASIKLGANNDQVWALKENGELGQVDPDGAPRATQFQLPAGTRDFALSPTAARVSYINADGAVHQMGNGAATQAMALPNALRGAPVSLAQTNNGDLFIASSAGEIWRKPPGQGADGAAWTRIAALDGMPAASQLGKLQVLRDGSLGAQDGSGALHRFDLLRHAWSTTTAHAGSDHRRAFEGLPGGSNWQHIRLNGAPLEYFKTALPSSKPGVAGHDDVEAVEQTLRGAMDQLSRKGLRATPDITTLAPEAQAIIAAMLDGADGHPAPTAGVDHASSQVLDKLEQQRKTLPRSTDSGKVHDPDHNALRAIANFRTQVLKRGRNATPPDPVTTRIGNLLRDGVCLPVNEPKTMIAMGRMLVAHAQVKQTIDTLQHAAQGNDEPAPDSGISDDAAAKVATLFDAGIVDRAHFKRTNAVSARLNAGMAGMTSGLVSAAHPVKGDDAAELGAKFGELVSNLRPGKESITLSFTHSKGVDLEGLWMFFNINSDTFGVAGKHVLSANKPTILTPLGTGSHGATLSMQIGRTDKGVQLVLSDSTTTAASLGVRIQWRLGGVWEKAGGKATLLAVAGGEGALIPGGAISDSRSIAMHFDQDDEGKVQRVIGELYSGQMSLTDLLERADLVANTRGDSFNVNTEAYAHAFVALRAIYGKPNENLKPGTQIAASNLVVPALDQVSGKINYDSSTRVSHDTEGNSSHHTKKGITGSADFNHISVVDISTWFSIPYGKSGSTQIQWKVPLWLSVLSRNLWNSKLEPKDASVQLGPDGALAAASVTVATKEALLRTKAGDRPLTAELFPQLPALLAAQPNLKGLIDTLNASPALRPAVTMELTPKALAALHTQIDALSGAATPPEQAKEELIKAVNAALSDPAQLRIARIDVAAAQAMPKLSIHAFGPLRAVHGQSHTFSEAGSSITVQYADGSDNATGFKAEGKALLGHAVRPNLAALEY